MTETVVYILNTYIDLNVIDTYSFKITYDFFSLWSVFLCNTKIMAYAPVTNKMPWEVRQNHNCICSKFRNTYSHCERSRTFTLHKRTFGQVMLCNKI